MLELPKKLQKKIENRLKNNELRELIDQHNIVDFSSNDYLGFARSKNIYNETIQIIKEKEVYYNGATGSRLLSGNHILYEKTEKMLAAYHNAKTALLFNSGYDANIGFFSSILQRGDTVFFDELIHASIRDGMKMSNAKSYKFAHNDIENLKRKLLSVLKKSKNEEEIYIVTESIFSMDGDSPDLIGLVELCTKYNCHLVIDEAHAIGVFGTQGKGIVQELGIEKKVFARINTFGKAMGCHGAVILGSGNLKSYLVNFARSFIYTTGLPPHALATVLAAYKELETTDSIKKLRENISFFKNQLLILNLKSLFIESDSAIHCCVVSGANKVKIIASEIQKYGFDIKPILSPTVTQGKERLRFCLHSYNTKEEIVKVLQLLSTFVAI